MADSTGASPNYDYNEKEIPIPSALKEENEKSLPKKVSYPKSVFFIVINEFCERFSFYGMRTILAIYLSNQLKYSDTESTVIYHVFIMVCYFFPLLGAIIADSYLGKFRTILYLSMVYAAGNIIMSVAALPDALPSVTFTMIGLLLIAFGTGGIKPCVSAFGGDQFVLPEQELQLQRFFSFFYFAINSGSFVSTFLTPILREVSCFNQTSCYSLAFGVPAILMVVAIVIYIGGKSFYKIKKPEGNIVVTVAQCVWHALTKKDKEKTKHWLDKAQDKYDVGFIEDIKAAFRVLLLFIPLPVFWALFDQQGSRWTFQATRMNGEIGSFKIQPDQMQVINPVLILFFIPLFESVVYPVLAKCNILTKPLQKLTTGGILAALSFIISAVVEMQLEPGYPVLPHVGEGQIRFYNGLSVPVTLNSPDLNITNHQIGSLNYLEELHVKLQKSEKFKIRYKIGNDEKSETIEIFEKNATSYTFMPKRVLAIHGDVADKSDNGNPRFMVIYSDGEQSKGVTINLTETGKKTPLYSETLSVSKPFKEYKKIALVSEKYVLRVDEKIVLENITMQQGGCYVALIVKTKDEYQTKIFTITPPNSIHILWLIPQYIVITAGEIMFSITGLEFSFTQAPLTMKSLMQAAWLITVALGNLIVVIVAEAKIFDSQTYEFLLFAGLMLIDMLIFGLMAMRYKYVETTQASPALAAMEKVEGTVTDP